MLLLGARQLGAALSGRGEEAAKAVGSVAQAAEERLGGGLRALLKAGGRLQSAGVDLVFDSLAPHPPGAAALAPAAFSFSRETAGALGELLPGDAALPWRELEDKLEAFELFKYARERLGIPITPGAAVMPLAEQLRRRAGLDTYSAVWVTEGLGYAHGAGAWSAGGEPRRLLADASAAGLPAQALIALHAGMGLAFAERSLAPLSAAPGGGGPGPAGESSSLGAALAGFLSLCRGNAAGGYEEITREALGLVARNLHPHLVAPIAARLAGIDALLVEYFWHGVGRGAYFAPAHALPYVGSARRSLAELEQATPDPPARSNALAGFAWALALVNIRRPEVVEGFLRQHRERFLPTAPAAPATPATPADNAGDFSAAVASGIASAVLVWHRSVGEDAWLGRFLAHAPDPADRQAVALWRRQVKEPCAAALEIARGARGPSIPWGSLFRYRPLGVLLAGLAADASATEARAAAP